MAKDDKAAASDKGKEKEVSNGVNGAKEPEKDKDGNVVKDGVKKGDLPPGTSVLEYYSRIQRLRR